MSEDRESRIEPGDVVQLRSGGPLMTVMPIERVAPFLRCAWFSDDGVLEDDFPDVVLRRVDPELAPGEPIRRATARRILEDGIGRLESASSRGRPGGEAPAALVAPAGPGAGPSLGAAPSPG